MRALYFAVLPALALAFFLSVASYGEEQEGQGLPPKFTNDDLKKYKKPNDFTAPPARERVPSERENALKKKNETKEKEYWCKRGTQYRRKIDKIQAKLKDLKQRLAEGEDNAKKKKDRRTPKDIEKVETLLKDTEQELLDLGAEAQRKGVPPGWLECRFEW